MKPLRKKTPGSAGAHLYPVRFELDHPTARAVCIAGCFNRWNPDSTVLFPSGDGRWSLESALPAGLYEYRMVVDGEWMSDPSARDSVPNPYGSRNSVLKVAASQTAAHLNAAEHLPFESTPH